MDWHWTWQDPVALGFVTFVVGVGVGRVFGRRRKARARARMAAKKTSRTQLTVLDTPSDE